MKQEQAYDEQEDIEWTVQFSNVANRGRQSTPFCAAP